MKENPPVIFNLGLGDLFKLAVRLPQGDQRDLMRAAARIKTAFTLTA